MNKITRRRFIGKTMAIGAAAVFPTVFIHKSAAAWEQGSPVHPNIDDLRVVGITDAAMTSGENPKGSWKKQDSLVVKDAVWENMDRLACSLAETGKPEDAWKGIFVKPPKKSWSDTVVAIKTNNLGSQHPHSAVMSKICHTLVDLFGVNPSNVHIYDANRGSNMKRTSPFTGLPEGCHMAGKWGGSSGTTLVPVRKTQVRAYCLKHLVNDSVDILINMAVCKGHNINQLGAFTATMKNHFGTFDPRPGHASTGLDYLTGINRTKEILGPMDKTTGRILCPRQQLCFVDALWASSGGPYGNSTHQTNLLAMGVLSPIVDYIMATDFRRDRMGWQINEKVPPKMLADFGYKPEDLPNGGKLIEA